MEKVWSSSTGILKIFLVNMQCSIQWKSNHLVKTKFWLAVRFLYRAFYGHLFEASAEYHMQSKTQQAESGHTTSSVRSKQMLYWSRQETKVSKIAAWGSRQRRACSICAASRWAVQNLPGTTLESWHHSGAFAGNRTAKWAHFNTPTGFVIFHWVSNLRARLKAELNCTVFMKHWGEGNQ